jgi:hypothetical protein
MKALGILGFAALAGAAVAFGFGGCAAPYGGPATTVVYGEYDQPWIGPYPYVDLRGGYFARPPFDRGDRRVRGGVPPIPHAARSGGNRGGGNRGGGNRGGGSRGGSRR